IDQSHWQYGAAGGLGLVVGTLVLFAARSQRRVLTGFACLLANFSQPPWRIAAFLQFASVILGGLIIFRTSTEASRRQGENRRRRLAEEGATGATRGRRPASKSGPKPAGPSANKRYTPPKPKPKRPVVPTEKEKKS